MSPGMDDDLREPDAPPSGEPQDGRARLLAALRRPATRGQAVAGVLLAVLGFAAVTQARPPSVSSSRAPICWELPIADTV